MCLTEPQCGTDLGLIRTTAEPGRRRQLPDHRHQDLHLGRRARPDREHHPSGAGAPARRARGHPGHQPVPGAEIPAAARTARRGPRNGVCLRPHRAQDGHQGVVDLRHELRRRDRLAGRRAASRHARDVHDDERRAPRRRHPGPGRRPRPPIRAPSPMPASACRAARSPARSTPTSRPTRSSSIPTCAACC